MEQLNWHWPRNSCQSHGIFHICLWKAFLVLVSLWKLAQELQEDKWHKLFPRAVIPRSPGSSAEWEPWEESPWVLGCCCFCAALNWCQTQTSGGDRQCLNGITFNFPWIFSLLTWTAAFPPHASLACSPSCWSLPFPSLLQGRISVQPYQPAFPPSFQPGFVLLFTLSFLFWFFFREHIR